VKTPFGRTTGPSLDVTHVYRRRLNHTYLFYIASLAGFVLVLSLLEWLGMSKTAIGVTFLLSTVLLYAGIGIMCRTTDDAEYYVAGRRVPAMYNGMATAADWLSAASFIGLAGTLYLTGYAGLAFVIGWTGGYCLVALLLAPYLRRFGRYTIPDFLGERFEGHLPRFVGLAATVICSFTYVIAQIYGVGLIAARLTGFSFELGIFVGLGGVLVCSFLGGMRAVTWTQVAQYIVLILAYLVPVVWLSVKQTGVPVPQAVYGQQLEKVSAREAELLDDPAELAVRALYAQRADAYDERLRDVRAAMEDDLLDAAHRVAELRSSNASLREIQAAERDLAGLPDTEAAAVTRWTQERDANRRLAQPLGGMPRHAQAFAGDPDGTPEQQAAYNRSRVNFLALAFCLMIGTAALPHILIRSYTAPTVREARESVSWSLLFIVALYVTAPALAVLVKYEVFTSLIGTPFDQLPAWIHQWSRVDSALLSAVDVNQDNRLQLAELQIGGDIITLATPEIAGMPFVVSAMVAAGGLAAALSTADGLLLTIANALSHDLYHKMLAPRATAGRRVVMSKVLLLLVAVLAASLAAQRPAGILSLVATAFSLAASGLFPALVLGIFWRRANRWGATCGMLAGFAVAAGYIAINEPWLRAALGLVGPPTLWWGVQPISAGVFGVPAGFVVAIVVSLLTPAPQARTLALVDRLRNG